MTWWQFLIILATAIINFELGKRIERRDARWKEKDTYPYRWMCLEPKCGFEIKGSDPVVVATQSERHKEREHE